MKAAKETVEVNLPELEALLERKREVLGEEDYQKLKKGLWALSYLTDLIGDKDTTISQLRALLMKPSTEKTRKVLEQAGLPTSSSSSHPPPSAGANESPKKKPGHGRNGAEAYRGAERIKIAHPSLKPGDGCPECERERSTGKRTLRCASGWWGGAASGYRLPIGASALQSVRRGVRGGSAGGRGRQEIRRKRRRDDRIAEVWQRVSVVSAGRTGGEPGDSVAGLDPVGDCRGNSGSDSARF